MATYLPNVNRYVSKTKDFTPDFKFLSDALAKRQDRYDTNYKKMNNLYGSVLHADLSREDNMHIRDEYVKNLAPRLQQISGMDLSLEQNIDAAKGVFTPFFEDDMTVRDIVFTKRYKTEMEKFNQFRQSKDEKIRSKYWDGGVKMLDFSMADFKKATREGSMNVRLPELVEKVDLVELGFNALKNSGMEVEDISFSEDGHYIITQKNGTLLTRRPAGKHPETGEMIYYNPAQNFILQTMMDDPNIQRYYQTKFYVEAREWWEANAEEYGGEEAAKKAFAEKTIELYKRQVESTSSDDDKELTDAIDGMTAWEAYKAGKGDLIPGSDEMSVYDRHLAEMEYLKSGNKKKQKRDGEILTDAADIEDLMYKAGNAYMSYFIDRDTKQAAALFADVGSSRTIEADKYALENHKHEIAMAQKAMDHTNKLIQTAFEKGWLTGEDGFTPLPWAENGNMFTGGPNNSRQPIAGDALTTGEFSPDETFDVIQDNINTTNEGLQSIKDNRFSLLEEYYSTMANNIGTDDNIYSAEGMKVNGKFMTWGEAKEYYTRKGHGDELKVLYDNISNMIDADNDDIYGPDLERSNPTLYYKLKSINNKIDNTTAKLLVGWHRQLKAYNNVLDLMTHNKEITMLERRMLDAYPLFNSRGQAQDAEKIQEKMMNDFAAYINGQSDLSPQDAAANFGFYSVEDMNNTIDGAKSGGADIARKHFNNVFNEFWGKHSVEELFVEIKNKMNKNMNKASSIPGIQNYNLKSHMVNQEQAGSGGIIYNIHPSDYVPGQNNTDANVQLELIQNLLNGPKQNYQVMLGDLSAGTRMIDGDEEKVEFITEPAALLSLQEFLRDKNIADKDPDAFTKGKGPIASIHWSERLGGSGDRSGWVITYGEEYASTHKSSNAKSNNNIALTIPQNSITVFASTEYGEINPNSVKNSYVGTTDYLVDLNKSRIISNDGGTVIFYRNGNGQMVYKASLSSYNKESGNIEQGTYTKPEILPPSSEEVDLIFDRMTTQLEERAKTNQSAMEAHKKESKK